MQAASLSPEKCIVVDIWITLHKPGGESRRCPSGGRQQSWVRYGECAGHHRGLRAGHAFMGSTRELGRARCLLAEWPEEKGYRRTKSPGVDAPLPCVGEPRMWNTKKEAGKVPENERRAK